jgi:hypothetical protein
VIQAQRLRPQVLDEVVHAGGVADAMFSSRTLSYDRVLGRSEMGSRLEYDGAAARCDDAWLAASASPLGSAREGAQNGDAEN